ncbi:COG4252 Predicted transmembrane sensor domain [Methylophilaceae bacterium]
MDNKLTQLIKRIFPDRLSAFGLILVILTVLLGAFVEITDPQALQTVRNTIFDQYQRWQPRVYNPSPVKIIDIDEESLAKIGQWPWSRTQVANLISGLESAGVHAIALDMIFSEPDRTSPKAVSKSWKLPADVYQEISKLPDHDEMLAKVLSQSPSVASFTLERSPSANPSPKRRYSVINMGESGLPYLSSFSGSVKSIDLLESSVAGNGAVNYIPDHDGVIRRVPLILGLGDQIYPSLVAETLRVAQKAHNYIIKTSPIKDAGIEGVMIGRLKIPTTPDGQLWLHFTEANQDRYIPAWKILKHDFNSKALEGNIVIIGTSAKGLLDQRHNPLGVIMPGVEAHAQALEQILNQTYLERPSWTLWLELLIVLVGGLLIGILALRTRILFSASLTICIIVAINVGAWIAFSRNHLLLDGFTPSLILFLTFIFASIVHHLATERKQRWIKEAFSRYVSPNLVSHLVEHPDSLELGGERKTCSFIFTDLSGFTSLMEKTNPADAVSLLNHYLEEMIAIAFRHNGTLDRIVGDAIAIMFSAPVTQADHHQRAYDCALEMHAFASKYANELMAKGIDFGHTRIGVHSGEVIVGNFGGSTIFDYRALGDTVNTAARLESVNKRLGTNICISESTLIGCKNVKVREVGDLVLKGKTQAIKVFAPTLSTSFTEAPEKDYMRAYALIDSNRNEAKKAFNQLAKTYPDDPLVILHVERLQQDDSGLLIKMDEK